MMNTKELYDKYLECGGVVSTDSRSIRGGELFFALRGENFDGNDYALKALEAGAKYAVVSADSAVANRPVGFGDCALDPAGQSRLIAVEDTLASLQALARWHRSMAVVDGKPLTVIALTGTNGKTTTKELIKAVLSKKYVVTATEGNLNNNIGVPLTLLKINASTQIAVVEMGASHPGDINELTAIALPNYGLVTNVGKSHLLCFGGIEGVMKTKGELYDYIQRTADKIFLNVDNSYLCKMAEERPDLQTIKYGVNFQGAKLLGACAEQPFLRLELASGTIVNTNLAGAYNADNVMAALAVGREFGVGEADAADAIASYLPSNNRSQILVTQHNTLIVDSYNANPTSMEAALANLDSIQAEKKAALLGNMLELGEESVSEHIRLLQTLGKLGNLDVVILVGEEFRKALDIMFSESSACVDIKGTLSLNSEVKWFATSDEAAQYLGANPLTNHYILIKGSRGSKMENVISVL